MFGSALIVFREVLEAALIVGVVAAATHNVPRRGRWILLGLVAGLIGAGVIAGLTQQIAELAKGAGQEIFNASVLGVAVLMLAWHNIWMTTHGIQLSAKARLGGDKVATGLSECSVLFVIVGSTVLREGSETVLFLQGIAASIADGDDLALLVGGGVGLVAGILTGYFAYFGLLRVPLRWFFSTTAALVLLLASGLASQAAGFLIQADLLPALGTPLWDTSQALPEDSAAGSLLHGLVGYQARPAGMQVGAFAVTLLAISLTMRLTAKPSHKK